MPDSGECGACRGVFDLDQAKTMKGLQPCWRLCPHCGSLNHWETAEQRFNGGKVPIARGGSDGNAKDDLA